MLVRSWERSHQQLERRIFDPTWLRPVLDDVADGFLVEAEERIVFINKAYASFLQYRPHELLDRDVSFFIGKEDAPRLLEYSRHRNHLEAAPQHYDFLARRKDQRNIRLDATVTTSRVKDRVLITAIARPLQSQRDDAPADARSLCQAHLRELLSARELEVMEMLLEGTRVKEIALTLEIDAKTVATHRWRMMKKLHLNDTRSLFQYAIRHGLVDWSI